MAISRRKALKTLGAVPVAAGFTWTTAEAQQAHEHVHAARTAAAPAAAKGPYKPKFFTAHEWATVKVLVDLIIPKDERSGSATDAGVPEFIDFILLDEPPPRGHARTPMAAPRQVAVRGGLRWLDIQCHERVGKTFVACTAAEQTALLDEIAWPSRARPAMSQGVAFFNAFRDLTASGFWSSKMGVEDLKYMGNVPTQWNGCPPEALAKLGLS
jgi:gluconate 2-dehydrogenase gamma chain